MIDQKYQEEFSRLPEILKFYNKFNLTSHPAREHPNGACIFCHLSTEETGHMVGGMKDRLIQCGHVLSNMTQCAHLFHILCLLKAHPVYGMNAQYSALERNRGTLQCMDHFCSSCFSMTHQQSAARGEDDDFVKVAKEIRVFHRNCLPVGSVLTPAGQLVLYNFQDFVPFVGNRCNFCSICGESHSTKKDKLLECKTCVHKFHQKCHQQDQERCRRCRLDEQLDFNLEALAEVEGKFRVVRLLPWSKAVQPLQQNPRFRGVDQVLVMICTLKGNYQMIMPIRAVQRVLPKAANSTFLSLKETPNAGPLRGLSLGLKAIHNFRPSVPEQDRSLNQLYKVSPTFGADIMNSAFYKMLNRKIHRTESCLELCDAGKFGKGVRATKDIKKGTRLAEYVGELISEEEMKKRHTLTENSEDSEALHYMYDTTFERKGKKVKCSLDGTVNRTLASFFNSSCGPNCATHKERIRVEVGDTTYFFIKLFIEASQDIPKGTELTIDYQWNSLCLCQSNRCRRPAPMLIWE